MSISITLFNSGVYNAGGILEGKVVCVLNTRKKIRGIRLKIRGCESTSWEEGESDYDPERKEMTHRTVHYSGDNTFLALQETLHGAGFINLGRYDFPFRFVLPKNIPSTYNGKHGHIRYYIKANVDIPMGSEYEDEKKFIVLAPINFSGMLRRMELNPTQYQDETNLCCFWCASDPLTLDVLLQKSAFVLGEVIPIKIHILNMSNVSIESLSVHLKRKVTEKCTSPHSSTKDETEIVASDVNTGVGAHCDRDYDMELRIPHGFYLPNFQNCQLFAQSFELKVEAEIPGCHVNMKVEIPVKIGHIPVNAPAETRSGITPVANPVAPLPPAPAQYPVETRSAINTIANPLSPFPPAPPQYPVETRSAINTIANSLAPFPPVPQQYQPRNVAHPNSTNRFFVRPNNAAPIGLTVPNLPLPFPGIPGNNLPRVHRMPPLYQLGAPSLPCGSCAPYPLANVPRDETTPSAPSKAELANDDFIILDGGDGRGSKKPAPPSYHDAMRK